MYLVNGQYLYQTKKQTHNEGSIGWAGLVFSALLLSVAVKNLYYNQRGAIAAERGAAASEHIADELHKINGSEIMNKLNGELEKGV